MERWWLYGIVKIKKYFIKNIPMKNCDKGKVIKVIDGDTIKVAFSHGEIKNVRLLLINSPEKKEMFWKEATEYAKKVLTDKTVYIEFEETKFDMFGRLLGYVWYKANDKYYLFNHEIVIQSLAKVSHVYKDTKYLDIIRSGEISVKGFKKLIWEVDGYADNKKNKFDMSVYDTNS